jgi:hypothetical protein
MALVLFSIIVLIILLGYQVYHKNVQLKNNGVSTLCKVIEIKAVERGYRIDDSAAFIRYNVNGKEYSDYVPNDLNARVGKCYELIYSKENPGNIKVLFNKEINCSKY